MIAELFERLIFGGPRPVDLEDGYTQKLLARGTQQSELEWYCGASKARVIGYRKDSQAIAAREQRMAGVTPFAPQPRIRKVS